MAEFHMTIPKEIHGQKYVSLTTFRKSSQGVNTPVWFAEENDKLYVMTRSDSGKYKRIRNNPQVKLAPCTMGGKITGPEFDGTARVLPAVQWPEAKKALHRKYWLSRLPFWSKKNEFLEIAVA
jgi:PPOX class probable F420-dependent enzyme